MSEERFTWAIHEVDKSKRFFEVDIEPPMIEETAIVKLIFSSKAVPQGVQLSSTLGVDHERWKVTWSEGEGQKMLAALNPPFQYFVLMSHQYGPGWRERARREQREMQLREIESNIWWGRRQKRFGRRSPNEVLD